MTSPDAPDAPDAPPPARSGDGLGRASALMASGSLVSRLLGIVRNALLGACIGGMTGASSAFQTANTLPNTIFILLSSGVLTAVLIPQLTRALDRPDGGRDAIDALLTASFALVGTVTVAATALAGPLIVLFRLDGAVRDLAIAFAYLCLPQIFFYAAYAIWSQLLNVKGRFGLVMWTPALANVVQIAGMVVFLALYTRAAAPDRWTPPMIWLLAGTSTLGIAIQALALLPALRAAGYRWRPSLRLRGHGFRSSGKVAGLMVAAVVIAQLGGMVTQAAINAVWQRAHDAGHLVAGINVYFMAFTIFMVPHGVVTVSILTGLLPGMTRASQRGNVAELRADVDRGLQLPLLAMVPLTCAAIALAVPGCALLNPAFDEASVQAVASAFSLMALGLVPYAVVGLQQRYSTAREDGRTFLVFQLVVTAIQLAVAGAILVLPDALAVSAVSLGQSISNAIASVVFLAMARRQLGSLNLGRLAALAGRLLLASAPAGVVAWLVVQAVRGWVGHGLWQSALGLAAGAVGFLGVFGVAVRLLNLHELHQLVGRLGRRFLPPAPRHAAH